MPFDLSFRLVLLCVLGIGLLAIVYGLIKLKNEYEIVERESEKIKKIGSLNQKYKFFEIEAHKFFLCSCSSKRQYEKMNGAIHLQKLMKEDLKTFSNILDNIEFNRHEFKQYEQEFLQIESEKASIPQKVAINDEHFVAIENSLIKKRKLNPTLDLQFEVEVDYNSPKGKYNRSKSESFNFDKIKSIFNNTVNELIEKEAKTQITKIERAKLTQALRYKILCRDDFKCQACGKSAKDGVVLHVDHIIPISEGGRTEINNLTTLCRDCNLGKGKRLNENLRKTKKSKTLLENLTKYIKQ